MMHSWTTLFLGNQHCLSIESHWTFELTLFRLSLLTLGCFRWVCVILHLVMLLPLLTPGLHTAMFYKLQLENMALTCQILIFISFHYTLCLSYCWQCRSKEPIASSSRHMRYNTSHKHLVWSASQKYYPSLIVSRWWKWKCLLFRS